MSKLTSDLRTHPVQKPSVTTYMWSPREVPWLQVNVDGVRATTRNQASWPPIHWSLYLSSEIKPVHPKGNQSWMFIGRTDAEAETPILWPPDTKNWLIWKDLDAWKDWRQEEKGMTEEEVVGWLHQLNGHEFDQALGVGDGQVGLVGCSPWGRKESDMTERLNWLTSPQVGLYLITNKNSNTNPWGLLKGYTDSDLSMGGQIALEEDGQPASPRGSHSPSQGSPQWACFAGARHIKAHCCSRTYCTSLLPIRSHPAAFLQPWSRWM